MNEVHVYVPCQAEEDEINRRVALKGSGTPVTASRCLACPKILEESEVSIKGYASGLELELCRRCASHVNTKQAIDAAEAGGFEVKARPVVYYSGVKQDGGHEELE